MIKEIIVKTFILTGKTKLEEGVYRVTERNPEGNYFKLDLFDDKNNRIAQIILRDRKKIGVM